MKNVFFGIISVLIALLVIGFFGEVLIRAYNAIRVSAPSVTLDREFGWVAAPNLNYLTIARDAAGEHYLLQVTSNEDGFRMYGDPTESRKKIFIVGDSFTHAVEVSDQETYYAHLANTMDVELFVYGAGGYGTLQEWMIIQEWIEKIDPDILLLQFCSNDVINNHYGLERASLLNNNGLKRPYFENGKIVHKLPKNLPSIRHFANKHSRFLYFILHRIDRLRSQAVTSSIEYTIYYSKEEVPEYRQALEVTQELLEKIRDTISDREIGYYLFSADFQEPYYSDISEIVNQIDELTFIKGIPQAIEKVEAEGITVRASDGAHWNIRGHEIVGKALINYFNSEAQSMEEVENSKPD